MERKYWNGIWDIKKYGDPLSVIIKSNQLKMLVLKKRQGFTFIEIFTTVSIMIILTTLTMVNFKSRGVKTSVEAQAMKLNSVLKQVQMMALTGEEVGGSRPLGYAVEINTGSMYTLFADMDGSNTRSGGDIMIQEFHIKRPCNIDSAGTVIVFKPPKAEIFIASVTGQKIITFRITSESKQVVIDVRTGQIDIQ